MKKINLVLAFSAFFIACGNNHSFDSATWIKSDARVRGRMCESLVAGKTLIGQTAEEAQRQLGAADKEYPTALAYKVDLGMPFKDPVHYGLQVHLDADRKVSEIKIVD